MAQEFGWTVSQSARGSDDLSGRHYRDDYGSRFDGRWQTSRGYSMDRDDGDSRRASDRDGRRWGGRRARSEGPERRGWTPSWHAGRAANWGFWRERRPTQGGHPVAAGYPGVTGYPGRAGYAGPSVQPRVSLYGGVGPVYRQPLAAAALPRRAFLGASSQAPAYYQPYISRPPSYRSPSDETISDSEENIRQRRRRRQRQSTSSSRCMCLLCFALLICILAAVIFGAIYLARSKGSAGGTDVDVTTESPGVSCGSTEWTCNNSLCVNESAQCDGSNDCGDFSDELELCGNGTATGYVTFNVNYTADLADPTSEAFQNASDLLCQAMIASFPVGTLTGCDTMQFIEGSVIWYYILYLSGSSQFNAVQLVIINQSTDQTIFFMFGIVIDIRVTAFTECDGVPCQNGGTCVPTVDHFSCICAAGWTDHLCRTSVYEVTTLEAPVTTVEDEIDMSTGVVTEALTTEVLTTEDLTTEALTTEALTTEALTTGRTTPSTTTTTTLRPCVGDEMTCYNGYCFNASAVCDGINDCGDWSDETVNCTKNAAGTVTFEVAFDPELTDTESETFVNVTQMLCDEVIAALPDPSLVLSCTTIAFFGGSVEWIYFLQLRNESAFEEVQTTIVDESTAQTMFQDFAPVVYIEAFSFVECEAHPCKHNASCYDIDGIYHCLCPLDWWGRHCDLNDTSCAQDVNPCNELGSITCINFGYEFYCPCNYGFTGVYCEIEINECDSQPCLNGATCDDCFDGYNCICQDGTTGTHCETDLDDCESNPCVNGSCVNDIGHFTCECDAGYTGLTCEVDIDDCALDPCVNNGTCVDLVNGYLCNCVCGYGDLTCSTNIDECASSPCQYGATCVDLVDAYYCQCLDGYTGDECSTETDECASSPCQNGGTCVDGINGYTCTCGLDAVGTNCQTEVNYGMGVAEDTAVTNSSLFTTVNVSTNIAFHGISYSEYTILAGGFVTFNKTYDVSTAAQYVYCGLDQGSTPTLSPYDDYHHPWYSDSGAIYYRETSEATLLSRAEYDVCTFYSFYAHGFINCTFTPTALSIISWVNMWPGVTGVATRNFQLVIATDGTRSFAIYLYQNVTTDCASKCLKVTGYEDPAAILPDNFILYPGLQDTLARGTDRIVYYMGSADNPCSSTPCSNGGTCIPTDDGGYYCDCHVNFIGERCQLTTTSGFIYF